MIFVWPEGILPKLLQEELDEYSQLFENKFNKNHLLIIGTNNYLDINGSSNAIDFIASGYSGTTSADSGYFYLDLDGSSNDIDITQSSTLARDYLKLITINQHEC